MKLAFPLATLALCAAMSAAALAPSPASASPELRDAFRQLSESTQRLQDSQSRLVSAKQRYAAKMKDLSAMAADVFKIIAPKVLQKPTPPHVARKPIIGPTATALPPLLTLTRTTSPPRAPRMSIVESLRRHRVRQLLGLTTQRASNPTGTSIYDSLTFARRN